MLLQKPGTEPNGKFFASRKWKTNYIFMSVGWWEDQFQIVNPESALAFGYIGFASGKYKSQ